MFLPSELRVAFTARGRVRLLEPLTWTDAHETLTVPAGFISDGVTSPAITWPFVGHPYSGSLLRAAVLHDWECVVRESPSPAVHRRFWLALRASGVGRVRAWLLWAAVRAFGPRWTGRVSRGDTHPAGSV